MNIVLYELTVLLREFLVSSVHKGIKSHSHVVADAIITDVLSGTPFAIFLIHKTFVVSYSETFEKLLEASEVA